MKIIIGIAFIFLIILLFCEKKQIRIFPKRKMNEKKLIKIMEKLNREFPNNFMKNEKQ